MRSEEHEERECEGSNADGINPPQKGGTDLVGGGGGITREEEAREERRSYGKVRRRRVMGSGAKRRRRRSCEEGGRKRGTVGPYKGGGVHWEHKTFPHDRPSATRQMGTHAK
jgi:hypothetical protein